ncbi:MAG: alpha/beta hydrolase [bacterium]|nr:alpha/beta hydrolase [bacterium]
MNEDTDRRFSTDDTTEKTPEKGKKPLLKRILKYCFFGCGTIVLIFACIVVWIGSLVHSATSEVSTESFHPYKSEKKQQKYLDYYAEREASWPIAFENRRVETSFGQTFVKVSGNPNSPPLVLLPGGNATSLMWTPIIEPLSQSCRTYAVDNIYDYGLSVYSKRLKTPDDYVVWLDELLTGLNLEDDVNLMGLSYGGWITSQYALNRPERLQSAVLLAPAATVLWFESEFLMRGASILIPHRHFAKSVMYWALEDAVKDPETRAFVDLFLDDLWMALKCFKFKQLVNPTVLTDEELRSIEIPTLFLTGENEKIYPPRQALERLARVAPQIETTLIRGAGHDLALVKADVVAQRILEFLAASASVGSGAETDDKEPLKVLPES